MFTYRRFVFGEGGLALCDDLAGVEDHAAVSLEKSLFINQSTNSEFREKKKMKKKECSGVALLQGLVQV